MKIVIAGTGKHLPDHIASNPEVVQKMTEHGRTHTPGGKPITPEMLETLVGIRERRWSGDDENTSDHALKAANQALERARITWQDLSIIRIGSSSPEKFFPSTACLTLFKAKGPGIEAVDCLAACTSGLVAMIDVQRALLSEQNYKYGLAVGAEVLATRMADYADLNSNLWGDGAGAVVLAQAPEEENRGIICSIQGSIPEAAPLTESVGKGTRPDDFCRKPNIAFSGHDIQRFVLDLIPDLIPRTLEKANDTLVRDKAFGGQPIKLGDIDMFAVHQANVRIFDIPAKKLGIPKSKFFVNVDRYGNTSSASVLICLAEMIEQGLVGSGSLVMLVAFGGGITYGSVLVRL
ncbi:MAG: fabH [Candidatus Berkelbacteria bacterium]|nr:fabH [Candidatus Berkelbacteria bacterium]